MAIVAYTGDTTQLGERFPPVAPTEHLAQASAPTQPLVAPTRRYVPWDIALYLVMALAFAYGAYALAVHVNDEAFTVAAAGLVGGFIWLALSPKGTGND